MGQHGCDCPREAKLRVDPPHTQKIYLIVGHSAMAPESLGIIFLLRRHIKSIKLSNIEIFKPTRIWVVPDLFQKQTNAPDYLTFLE